ncbi:MAG: hypothetical protein LIO87_02760, partial [Eubacterium sp.]|nr:hypothetical protein [Eubacterium sp.]
MIYCAKMIVCKEGFRFSPYGFYTLRLLKISEGIVCCSKEVFQSVGRSFGSVSFTFTIKGIVLIKKL